MDPGEVVASRYRIEAIAGAGAAGSVFRATDLTAKTPCALKVIREGRRNVGERFVREVRALQQLRHRAVVRYIDHGLLQDGTRFLVMEWASGECLRDRLTATGPTVDEALGIVHRLADALVALHEAGIVHRDIKPRNLMLREGTFDDVRLVDFGIARFAENAADPADALTATGVRLGTPGYMAPEQILEARTVDGRADVFSLGCVAFELLTGQRAYRGADDVARLAKVVLEDAPRMRRFRADLPPEIDELVARMLSRDLDKRPRADPALVARIAELRARFVPMHMGIPPSHTEDDDIESLDSADLAFDDEAEITSLREPSIAPLVGRTDELAALAPLVAVGSAISLWGPAGIGKSRVLHELALRLSRSRPVTFVDVSAAHDVDAVLRVVAARLVVARAGERELVRALRGRVLVLDGLDATLDALQPVVDRWKSVAAVVLGARQRAAWAEVSFEVGPLAPAEAVRFLATRAKEAGALLRPEDDAALKVVAERLEGNPLSMELAAAHLAETGAHRLSTTLERPIETLGRPLEDAIAMSWQSLTPAEQHALGRLAFFDGPFLLEHAIALAGSAPIVDALRDRSLLSGKDPLAMSSAVRELARARATPDAEERHARFVVEVGTALGDRARRGDAAALERLDLRADDLLSIAERGGAIGARATLAVDPALMGRVPSAAHHRLLGDAIENAELDVRGRLMCARGRVAMLLGQSDAARRDISEALERARSAGDVAAEAAALMELTVVHHMTGEVEAGARCCYGVLALRDRFDDPRLLARAVGNLGGLLHDAGRHAEAYARYVEAIALAESAADQRLLGVFLANLAVLDADHDRQPAARRRLQRAIGALRRAREDRLVAIALANLGMVELELDLGHPSRINLERAVKILEEIGDERSEALARARLGAAYASLGDAAGAEKAIATARHLARSDTQTSSVVDVYEAFLHLARGDQASARASYDRAFVQLAHGRDVATASDDARAALRVLTRRIRDLGSVSR